MMPDLDRRRRIGFPAVLRGKMQAEEDEVVLIQEGPQ